MYILPKTPLPKGGGGQPSDKKGQQQEGEETNLKKRGKEGKNKKDIALKRNITSYNFKTGQQLP